MIVIFDDIWDDICFVIWDSINVIFAHMMGCWDLSAFWSGCVSGRRVNIRRRAVLMHGDRRIITVTWISGVNVARHC
jgi:hypothetical protein